MTDLDSLTGIIEKIVSPMFKYKVSRIGKVVDNQDPDREGKVLCQVPSLGWDTNAKAAWCFSSKEKGIIVPKVGTYVLIDWIDGNDRFPVYRGIPTNLKNQIPSSYDGDPKTNILFQSDTEDIIKYIKGSLQIIMEKEILLGDSPIKGVSRIDDPTLSTATDDSIFWTWLTAAASVLAGLGVAVPAPVSLTGKITGGSAKVKAGD